ncbi:MAG: penicillin-binding protein, partial [Firmicutes bacterium]|nr:penicillin-binding protein [Bacillota bacterium]
MRNNVVETYGDDKYPGLELHAKSGTAEAAGQAPNSWFCGFSGDYAFVVCVEKGGYGSAVAGPVANTVLQEVHRRLDKTE